MSYSVIKADPKKNRDDIFNIWEKNFPGALEKKFVWIYENNPAGPAQVWLVRHEESGEYVGVTALFPRRFVINGKSFTGGIAGDLLVNRDHRSAGPALKLQRSLLSAIQDGTVDFVYGFPNKASEAIHKRVGYKVLGEKVRLVKIVKAGPQVSKLPIGRYPATLVSPFLDLTLRLFSFDTWHCFNKYVVCEEVKDVDERFGELWRKVTSKGILTGERTEEYLRWKYLNSPHGANKIFAAFDADNFDVKGYIVYRHSNRSIEIRDFLFIEDEKAVFGLMAGFLKKVRSSGAQSIIIALLRSKKIADYMKRFGFLERKDKHRVLIYCPKQLLVAYPVLKDIESWVLLQSDDDM